MAHKRKSKKTSRKRKLSAWTRFVTPYMKKAASDWKRSSSNPANRRSAKKSSAHKSHGKKRASRHTKRRTRRDAW